MDTTATPHIPGTRPTLRLRYSKLGKIRFTSQRDAARIWERTLRRSPLAVAWSEGFSPHPLLSFGLGLPTGCSSLAEYLDVHLVSLPELDIDRVPEELSALLPEGMDVSAAAVMVSGTTSLQHAVTSCTWELEVLGVAEGELAERIERFLALSHVPVHKERKGRIVESNLRPMVRALTPLRRGSGGATDAGTWMRAEVATQPQGVRPNELVVGLGGGHVLARACRTHQWIEQDGARCEPLPLSGATPDGSRPRAERCAS